jgi:multidrug efflux pump subunit AcrA (membrane-fusion protein)
MPFKEGSEVKEGDLLFQIDTRPYQALVDEAQALVVLAQARRRSARANNARYRTIAAREPGAFSRQELETYQAQEIEADASVKIDRPIFASVLSIVITLTGTIALHSLPIAQYARITPPGVQVSIRYPGANAQVVWDTVAAPIEEQVNGEPGMFYMSLQ